MGRCFNDYLCKPFQYLPAVGRFLDLLQQAVRVLAFRFQILAESLDIGSHDLGVELGVELDSPGTVTDGKSVVWVPIIGCQ